MTSTPFLDRSFQLASLIALSAWAALFLLPGWVANHAAWMTIPVALLCAIYGYVLLLGGRYDLPGTRPHGHFRSMGGVLRLFQSLNQLGTTVLIASHDQALAARSGARILRLEGGRLVGDRS